MFAPQRLTDLVSISREIQQFPNTLPTVKSPKEVAEIQRSIFWKP